MVATRKKCFLAKHICVDRFISLAKCHICISNLSVLDGHEGPHEWVNGRMDKLWEEGVTLHSHAWSNIWRFAVLWPRCQQCATFWFLTDETGKSNAHWLFGLSVLSIPWQWRYIKTWFVTRPTVIFPSRLLPRARAPSPLHRVPLRPADRRPTVRASVPSSFSRPG